VKSPFIDGIKLAEITRGSLLILREE